VKADRDEEVELTGHGICESGRFWAGSERERELWMSKVVKRKRKKW